MKTQYLLIDTCSWIDNVVLIRSGEDEKVLEILEDKIKKKELILILPETVEIEFNRRVHQDLKAFKGYAYKAKNAVESEHLDKQYTKAVSQQIDGITEEIERQFQKNEKTVLKIFSHPNIIHTKITPEVLVDAQKRGMMGLAPYKYQFEDKEKKTIYHCGVQSDCLIIEEIKSLLVNEKNYELYICSGNYNNFADKENNSKIHPEIAREFESCKYFAKLSTLLNHFKANIDEKKLTEPIKPTVQDYPKYVAEAVLRANNFDYSMIVDLATPKLSLGTISMFQNVRTAIVEANKNMESVILSIGEVPELITAIGKSKEALTSIQSIQSVFSPPQRTCAKCGNEISSLVQGAFCSNCHWTSTFPGATKLY
jgi:hypothetical protein